MANLPEDVQINLLTISHPVSTQIDYSKSAKSPENLQHDTIAMTELKRRKSCCLRFPQDVVSH